MRFSIRVLTEDQVDTIHCSPLIYLASYFTAEVIELVKHDFTWSWPSQLHHVDCSWWFSCPWCFWKWFLGWAVLSPSQDHGEADRPLVPWVLCLALFEDRSGICFPLVFGCFSQLPWLIQDYQKWSCSDTCYFPQCSQVRPLRASRLVYIYPVCLSVPWPYPYLPCSSLSPCFLRSVIPEGQPCE